MATIAGQYKALRNRALPMRDSMGFYHAPMSHGLAYRSTEVKPA